jgi:hypothetical protein
MWTTELLGSLLASQLMSRFARQTAMPYDTPSTYDVYPVLHFHASDSDSCVPLTASTCRYNDSVSLYGSAWASGDACQQVIVPTKRVSEYGLRVNHVGLH